MILQKCSKCGAMLESPGSLIGQEDYCPLCKQRFIVQSPKKSRLKLGGIIAAGVVFLVILLAVAFFMGKASNGNAPKYTATQKPTDPLDIAKETRKEIVIQEANPRVTIVQDISKKAPTQKTAAQPNIVDARAKEAIIGVIRKIAVVMRSIQAPKDDFDKIKNSENFAKMAAQFRKIDTTACPKDFVELFQQFISSTDRLSEVTSSEHVFAVLGDNTRWPEENEASLQSMCSRAAQNFLACLNGLCNIAEKYGASADDLNIPNVPN